MTLSNNALASLQANGTSTTAYSSNSNTRSDASSLGQDDFLKLMMEQLRIGGTLMCLRPWLP